MGDGSSFFLSVDFFISKKLSKGSVVDQALLNEIKEESLFVEAYIKAISLLSRQHYSRFNLRRKLLSKDFDNEGVEKTLEYLEKQGYINDKLFAIKWVESRLSNKLDSYNTLLAGLMKKGIKNSICKDVLHDIYTEEVNDQIIIKSINKLIKNNKTSEVIIKKLVNKGFNVHKVRSYIEHKT